MRSPKDVRQFVNSLPSKANAQVHSAHAFIKCPKHKGGQERTPSMKISFIPGKRYQPGNGHCFGCGENMSMNDIAAAYGLSGYIATSSTPKEVFSPVTQDEADDILGKNGDRTYGYDLSRMTPWNATEDWRGIRGKVVRGIGGMLMYNYKRKKNQLYLPVYINGVHFAGIQANIVKKGKANYFNTKGGWSSQALFPYDYVKDNLDTRTVVLVEGPRDALNLVQYGIPALALIGAGNWCEAKELLLLSLDPEKVITALDPDEAGLLGTQKIFKSLKTKLEVKMFKMQPEDEDHEKEDPGNLTRARLRQLKKHL